MEKPASTGRVLLLIGLVVSLASLAWAEAAAGAGGWASGVGPAGAVWSPEATPVCPTATRRIHVPAVVGSQEGGLLQIEVSVAPGTGDIYTTVEPLVGASTQASERLAVAEAFAGSRIPQEVCDVRFRILDGNQTPAVDGPSAGLAMAVATRAAVRGEALRADITITGAILPGGAAGEVGGIIDKAQAASRLGQTLLITPRQRLYENILLRSLGGRHNFTAVEVSRLSEAYAIATSPPGTAFNTTYRLESRPLPPGLPARALDEGDRRFARVAARINDELARVVGAGANGPLAPYREYFGAEVAQNTRLIEAGYGYTAANNAFLSQVDAAFLTTPPRALDVEATAREVQACLSAARPVEPTEENFEWVAGGEARLAWARQKLEDVGGHMGDYQSSEDRYLAVRELYYAQSWCVAGGYLLDEAREIGGRPLDVGGLGDGAARELARLRGAAGPDISGDADAEWHLGVANRTLAGGDYLAALYDISYVQGVRAAAVWSLNATPEGVERRSQEQAERPLRTLWGRTYQAQGQYMRWEALEGNRTPSESLRVLALSQGLESGMGAIRQRLLNPPTVVEVAAGGADKEMGRRLDVVAAGIALGLVAAMGVALSRMPPRKPKA